MKLHSIVIAVGLLCAQQALGQKSPTIPAPAGAVAAAAGPGEPPPKRQERIRLDFREASILQVIRLLAELSGTNIVATEKASEIKVSVFLQGMTPDAALDAVSKAAGLWYRKDEGSGVWRVMTLEEYQRDIIVYRAEETRVLTLRNTNVVATANAIAALFGSRVRLVAGVEDSASLGVGGASGSAPGTTASSGAAATASGGTTSSAESGAAASAQTGRGTGKLSAGQIAAALELPDAGATSTERESRLANDVLEPPRIFITYNRGHNLLIARSSDREALREIERLVADLDRPTRQVLLEMKILEVSLGDDFRSVFDLGLTAGSDKTPPAVGVAANPFATGSDAPTSAPQLQLGAGNFPLEGGSFIFQFMNSRVVARIQALASENRVKTLATPMLLASNNQPARLFIGEERVLTTGITANTTTNANQTITTFSAQTEKRNIGNTLLLLPRINADRTVTLSIQQDSSTVLPKSTSIPVGSGGSVQSFPIDSVSTANLQVTVVAKDRLAVAVGGMIRERSGSGITKVPFLGDVPILGEIFTRREKSDGKTEMVLLITPYILDSPEEAEDRSRERVGQLTRQPNALTPLLQPGPEAANEAGNGANNAAPAGLPAPGRDAGAPTDR